MSSFSISVKDYAIAAGQTLRIQVPGTFFQLMEATAAVDVSIMRAHSIFGNAEAVPLGFSVGPLNDADAFDGVEIYSATAQTVKVCIARGAVDLRSITQVSGTVQVINGELERVKAGEVFIRHGGGGPSVGNYTHIQLWNPAASGKNVVVSSVTVLPLSGASAQLLAFHTAALAALQFSGVNKKAGGVASSAEVRYEQLAAPVGTAFANVASPAAVESKAVPFSEPLILPPGYGLIVRNNSVNVDLYSTFQWFEEVI